MLLDLLVAAYIVVAVCWMGVGTLFFIVIFREWSKKGDYSDALALAFIWAISGIWWPIALIIHVSTYNRPKKVN